MHSRSRASQKTPSLQHYIRIDDEVEILVDKPVLIKMEKDQYPYLNIEKKSNVKKGRSNILEYVDHCPETSFTPHAFYTPAQLVPKKRGNKNCVLYGSMMSTGLKKSNTLNPSAECLNGVENNINCDTLELRNRSTNLNYTAKSIRLRKEGLSPSELPWKKSKTFSSSSSLTMFNSAFQKMHSKILKNGSLNNVNNIEPLSHKSFYDPQSSLHVVNEADTPPFTPTLEINCCGDSSSCSEPDIVYLKSEPASPSTKVNPAKRRKNDSLLRQNQRSRFNRNSIMSPLSDKALKSKNELKSLYKNLEEISWAQDKSFKSLLASDDAPCHSVRKTTEKASVASQAKAKAKTQKGVLKVSPNRAKNVNNVTKPAKKSASKPLGKNTTRSLPATKPKSNKNSLSAFVKKKLQKRAKFTLKKTCNKKTLQKNPRTVIRYKFNPAVIKAMPPPKPDARKKDSRAIATISSKNVMSLENSEPKKGIKASNAMFASDKTNTWGSVHKTPNMLSILQNKQALRVSLEPLENTNLFARNYNFLDKVPDVIEAYTRKSLQQSMLRVFTDIDQKHISSVLRDSPESKSASSSSAKASRKRRYDEESVRSSVRQSECAFRYKEIVVRKHESYIQIVLVPNMYRQNCLTIEAMKELKEAFLSARKDLNCKAVLLNSSGTYFCSGIDLSQLHGSNKKHLAEEMAITIRDLILTLALFPKPVVAAVNGTAIGLGVSLLTFCDVVLSSDKATFCIPSTQFGYIPEGGALLTLPQVVGSTVAMEMLLQGRCLTAEQALKYGLVSEILWPTQLMEEVVPRILSLVQQPVHVMEATKTMVRCHLWEKLAVQLNEEWHVLVTQWLSQFCQQKIKQHMQTGWQID